MPMHRRGFGFTANKVNEERQRDREKNALASTVQRALIEYYIGRQVHIISSLSTNK